MSDPGVTVQIARAIFDSPVALLNLAVTRADDLRIELGFSGPQTWVALFGFAMPINALRDWVKARRPELEPALNKLIQQEAIAAFADIANAGKHVVLERRHTVRGITKTDKVPFGTLNEAGNPEQRTWRLSVELADGSSRYVEDLADEAIAKWREFFEHHAIE